MGQNSLYIEFDKQSKTFANIINKPINKGFILNNYEPYNFNEKTIKGIWSLWDSDFENYLDDYQSIGAGVKRKEDYSVGREITSFIVYLPAWILMSPIFLLSGIPSPQTKYFDYPRFNKDAQAWVTNNGIDRETILSKYDSLVTLKNSSELLIQNQRSAEVEKLNKMYQQAKESYSQHPEIHKIYVDNSKLYSGERLSEEVQFVENKIDKKQFLFSVDYNDEVNSAFPCQKDCVVKLDSATASVQNEFQNDKERFAQLSLKTETEYAKYLQATTKTLNVKHYKGSLHNNYENKRINYVLKSKDSINAKAKKLDVTYVIENIDYKEVYPSFSHSNHDIKVDFDSESKRLKFINNTNDFIQINSVSLYYNGGVHVLTDSANSNYSAELSPQASSLMTITQNISQASYSGMTKAKALAKKLKFGFAVKYTKGNSNQKHTLYKTKQYALYPLIKNIKGTKVADENTDNFANSSIIAMAKGYGKETRLISLGKYSSINRSYIENHCRQGAKDYDGKNNILFYDYCKKYGLQK